MPYFGEMLEDFCETEAQRKALRRWRVRSFVLGSVALAIVVAALLLLAGCGQFAPLQCGDLLASEARRKQPYPYLCPGKWVPVPTGPWWRCECGAKEVQP